MNAIKDMRLAHSLRREPARTAQRVIPTTFPRNFFATLFPRWFLIFNDGK
jgi:hypothetical protein